MKSREWSLLVNEHCKFFVIVRLDPGDECDQNIRANVKASVRFFNVSLRQLMVKLNIKFIDIRIDVRRHLIIQLLCNTLCENEVVSFVEHKLKVSMLRYCEEVIDLRYLSIIKVHLFYTN